MRYNYLYIFLTVLILSNCARVGRPTGGEKDIDPPVSIRATPDFNSLYFKKNTIKIYFDEYIKLKDLNQQLVISPPLKNAVEITPLGTASKRIQIKINDTLKENTTYTFYFGNAIVDNTEGNPLKAFKYLFSTGNFIDSLEIKGSLNSALYREKPANISVLLYAADSTFHDSLVYHTPPNYIAKSDEDGNFFISNIKEGDYHIIALKDMNTNLHFDASEDEIAFLDSPITIPTDSSFNLKLFKEKPGFSIKNVSQLSTAHFILSFEGTLNGKVNKIANIKGEPLDFFSYSDRKTDTLHLWLPKIESDSIQISFKNKDSLFQFPIRIRKKENDSLQLTKSINSFLPLKDSLFVFSTIPLDKISKDNIKLTEEDSIAVVFHAEIDTKRDRLLIDFDKKYKTNYKLDLFPNAIADYLGHTNDSLQFVFKTKSPEDYGEIVLSIQNDSLTPCIIELLNAKNTLVSKHYISDTHLVKFEMLDVGDYQVRAIYDTNNNRVWDSGDYLKRSQPEKVKYFSNIIEVRANWSITEQFVLD